jgi:hypothetical protein
MIEHADGLPQPQRAWAIVTIALGIAMSVVDGAIADVALPTIGRDLQASPAFSIWIVNGYQLAITISLLRWLRSARSSGIGASTCPDCCFSRLRLCFARCRTRCHC